MKFSKHPIGTVVEIQPYGRFEKVEPKLWKSLEEENTFFTTRYIKKTLIKAEGVEVKIVAAPWSVVVELLAMLQEEYGSTDSEGKTITFDSIYKDAMERDAAFQERQAAKRERETIQNAYCAADVKFTAAMFADLSKKANKLGYIPYSRSNPMKEWEL